MTYSILPLTDDSWQVFTADVLIDREMFHAQIEVRYLEITGSWFFSLWDHASGELLVNNIPLVCSYGLLNDLLFPFRSLRDGKGVGSLFCVCGMDEVLTSDPSGGNLTEFVLLYGDQYDGNLS